MRLPHFYYAFLIFYIMLRLVYNIKCREELDK